MPGKRSRKVYSVVFSVLLLVLTLAPLSQAYAGTCEVALDGCLKDCESITVTPLGEAGCKSGCYIAYMGCEDGDPDPGIPE